MTRKIVLALAWLLPVVLSACAPTQHLTSHGLGPLHIGVPRRLEGEAPATPQAPTAGRRIALFLPDRLLDLADIVSLGIGVGAGFDVHRQISCGFHIPSLGIYKSFNPVNWYYKRNLCWCVRTETETCIFGAVYYKSTFQGGGTGWNNGKPGSGVKKYFKKGIADAKDPIHTEGFRDPMAIGIGYGPVILSPRIEIEFHVEEFADFAAGLVTLGFEDIRGDDLATPKPPGK
ncbi:hypothetical protein ACFL09_04265 [Planctomycetota bacterium]